MNRGWTRDAPAWGLLRARGPFIYLHDDPPHPVPPVAFTAAPAPRVVRPPSTDRHHPEDLDR
jgi:hypothetical protein